MGYGKYLIAPFLVRFGSISSSFVLTMGIWLDYASPKYEPRLDQTRLIFIPNRTFLVRFGGISGEFGRAMVRILARRSRAKIPMVRPNELDMLPKRIKKGAIRYLPYPNSS